MILFILFFYQTLFGQWKYEEDMDPFEGKTKYISAFGTGGRFPYRNPRLIFRQRNNEIDAYITNAGSLACESGLQYLG